jgi:hypothetical protein
MNETISERPASVAYRVALGGKDTNPGTAGAPFATIQAARDAEGRRGKGAGVSPSEYI